MKMNHARLMATTVFASMIALSVSAQSSYEISGYASGSSLIGGASGTITSLEAENVAAANNGDSVTFMMANASNHVDVAQLKVTLVDITVNGVSGGGNVRLAHTVDSQGLVDTGTLTFALNADGVTSSSKLKFEWFGLDGVTPFNDIFTVTSYDLDFNQKVSMDSAQVGQYFLSDNTDLTYSSVGGTDTFLAGNNNAVINDADAAFAVRNPLGSVLEFDVGKTGTNTGDLLFMFEFRNPPTNLDTDLIPEPSVMLLFSFAGAGAFFVRRTFLV